GVRAAFISATFSWRRLARVVLPCGPPFESSGERATGLRGLGGAWTLARFMGRAALRRHILTRRAASPPTRPASALQSARRPVGPRGERELRLAPSGDTKQARVVSR